MYLTVADIKLAKSVAKLAGDNTYVWVCPQTKCFAVTNKGADTPWLVQPMMGFSPAVTLAIEIPDDWADSCHVSTRYDSSYKIPGNVRIEQR
jgi:hypothetical protein